MFNFHSYLSFSTFISSVFVVVALALLAPLAVQAFFSSGTTDFTGYAWSDTVGWISFESSDGANVTINTDDTVTGYGWSPNIGWVKFGGLSSFPASGDMRNLRISVVVHTNCKAGLARARGLRVVTVAR